MSADAVTGDDDAYHLLILRGYESVSAGHAARRTDILALHAEGLRPPAIARELERRAREAGRSDAEIRLLGISKHNVRVVLRAEVADQDIPTV